MNQSASSDTYEGSPLDITRYCIWNCPAILSTSGLVMGNRTLTFAITGRNADFKVRFPVKPEIFRFFLYRLDCFLQLRGSFLSSYLNPYFKYEFYPVTLDLCYNCKVDYPGRKTLATLDSWRESKVQCFVLVAEKVNSSSRSWHFIN